MKIVTVSGAGRGVGKTTFARALARFLPGKVEIVKIGHGRDRGKPERLLHSVEEALYHVERLRRGGGYISGSRVGSRPGTGMEEPTGSTPPTDYLIMESNRILSRLSPDLAIFVARKEGDACAGNLPGSAVKPSSLQARSRSNFVLSRTSVLSEVRNEVGRLKKLDDREREAVLQAAIAFLQGEDTVRDSRKGACGDGPCGKVREIRWMR